MRIGSLRPLCSCFKIILHQNRQDIIFIFERKNPSMFRKVINKNNIVLISKV